MPVAAGMVGLVLVPAVPLMRRYGRAAAARYAAGAGAAVLAQQALVAAAAGRRGPPGLAPVDVLTCGRGATAAVLAGMTVSGVRDRAGVAGWLGWLALAAGSVALDWLDGPIARRLGTTPAGAVLDLEADSWLTLSASVAASAWGGLPVYGPGPPLLRYLLLARALRRLPYRRAVAADSPWIRWAGIAQMLLFTAALAPFGGRATRLAVRIAAPVVGAAQTAVLLTTLGRAGR